MEIQEAKLVSLQQCLDFCLHLSEPHCMRVFRDLVKFSPAWGGMRTVNGIALAHVRYEKLGLPVCFGWDHYPRCFTHIMMFSFSVISLFCCFEFLL